MCITMLSVQSVQIDGPFGTASEVGERDIGERGRRKDGDNMGGGGGGGGGNSIEDMAAVMVLPYMGSSDGITLHGQQ